MPKKSKNIHRKKSLTPQQKEQNKLKQDQEREIRSIFTNMGFKRISGVDGKHVEYRSRTTEMDDIFVCENLILIVEYTIAKDPGDHIKDKSLFYSEVTKNKTTFIEFLLNEPKLKGLRTHFDANVKDKYSIQQLRIVILYCSRNSVSQEHESIISGVTYFDYHIVQYFKNLAKVLKRTGRYEFCDFIGIRFEEFGENILKSDVSPTNKYSGHILPEEKSYFKEGYKIISFYIDANSLMRRAFVLRQEGWRKTENIGHYQRLLNAKKISNMRNYLSEKKRVFVNNIIATISEDKIKLYDQEGAELNFDEAGQFSNSSETKATPTKIEISDEVNIIGLIDGQHRTFAYHEGDDVYEPKIKPLRDRQNLLVTGIIFPKNENAETRLKFQANLFLEINTTQTNVSSQLKQEIELMIDPFSNISIAKRILNELNKSGPFANKIEQYSFEKGKLKTASIVSFGLKPLIKIDETSTDSLFKMWNNPEKLILKQKETDRYDLIDDYINFSVENIRYIFIAVKQRLSNEQWSLNSHKSKDGILNVTFFNGILNVLRLLIENNKIADIDDYYKKLQGLHEFDFREYKSSRYRKMGEDIYEKYFGT